MIPLCDVTQQYRQLQSKIDVAIASVLAGGHYILGPNVTAFEREIAEYLGCGYAVGIGSGTDALHLALRGLGVGPDDEVITTPFTFIASTEAIGLVGARPVFVDVDPHTFNIDPSLIEAAITDRTKAILLIHLYGQPCDMDAIMQVADAHAIPVVEDCAQAIGATYKGRPVGTFGVAGCFSFFPTKNLGCCGDGGMVVTSDDQLRERVEMLRRHGGRKKYHHDELGLNSRLDELQAAILRVKLPHLDDWNQARRACAYRYNRLFASTLNITRPTELAARATTVPTSIGNTNNFLKAVYHQYTLLLEDRDAAHAALTAAGIGNATYYPLPLHLQPVHADLGYRPGDFPIAESVAQSCLSLPMFPELQYAQQQRIAETLQQVIPGHPLPRPIQRSLPPLETKPAPSVEAAFSLDSYRSLLMSFLQAGYAFAEFQHADAEHRTGQPYVLLRHDIDMDLERARDMARIENSLDVRSTYFVLLRTEHYNLLSRQSTACMQEILSLGHSLGLHFDYAAYDDNIDEETLVQQVRREQALLGSWFEREVSIVSFHRPTPSIYSGSTRILHSLDHTYLPKYVDRIHYCSDSRGRFGHGHPLLSPAFASHQSMQLLIHPIWWGQRAASAIDELRLLADRRQQLFLQSLANNCTVFQLPRRKATA